MIKPFSGVSAMRLALACLVPGVAGVAGQAPRTLRLQRDIMLGADEHDFSSIRAIALSSRGILAVMQPQDSRILFFDASGKSLGSFGRKGEGPGEFQLLGAGGMGWTGDSLWVVENRTARVTLIGPDLKLIRVLNTPAEVLPPSGTDRGYPGGYFAQSLFPDGSLLLTRLATGDAGAYPAWFGLPAGTVERQSMLLQVRPNGQLRGVVAPFIRLPEPPDVSPCPKTQGPGFTMPTPFCGPEVLATDLSSPNRLLFYGVEEHANGQWAKYRIVSFDAIRRDTIFSRSYTHPVVEIPKRVQDSARQAAVKLVGGAATPAGGKVATMKLPRYFRPVWRLFGGTDGSVWLQEFTASSTMLRWRVLDGKGNLLGTLEVPQSTRLLAGRADTVWAVEVDADGLENLVRYKVR